MEGTNILDEIKNKIKILFYNENREINSEIDVIIPKVTSN